MERSSGQHIPEFTEDLLKLTFSSALSSLFLKDAGIEFKDIRYKYDDTWPATSKQLQEQGITRTGKLPVLEYKGVRLAQVGNIFHI